MMPLPIIFSIVLIYFAYKLDHPSRTRTQKSHRRRVWFFAALTPVLVIVMISLSTFLLATQYTLYCEKPREHYFWHIGMVIGGLFLSPISFLALLDWVYLGTNVFIGKLSDRQLRQPFSKHFLRIPCTIYRTFRDRERRTEVRDWADGETLWTRVKRKFRRRDVRQSYIHLEDIRRQHAYEDAREILLEHPAAVYRPSFGIDVDPPPQYRQQASLPPEYDIVDLSSETS